MYTIVEAAKANDLNPRKYLRYLYDKLPQGSLPTECLPWIETDKLPVADWSLPFAVSTYLTLLYKTKIR